MMLRSDLHFAFQHFGDIGKRHKLGMNMFQRSAGILPHVFEYKGGTQLVGRVRVRNPITKYLQHNSKLSCCEFAPIAYMPGRLDDHLMNAMGRLNHELKSMLGPRLQPVSFDHSNRMTF